MTSGQKTALGVVLVVLGLLLASCLVCGLVARSYTTEWAEGMMAEGQAMETEARAFAASHDQNACLDEALARDHACGAEGEIMCHVRAGVFLERCIPAATPVSGFCEGIPPTSEIMASVNWSLQQCEARGLTGDQSCGRTMQAWQRACQQPRD